MQKDKLVSVADWARAYLSHVQHVFRRGNHYVFDGSHYVKIEDQMMHRAISHFVSSVKPTFATAQRVEQIVKTIAQMSAISSIPSEPLWLDGTPAENYISFANGVLQLSFFIQDKCIEPSLLPAPRP